MARSLSIALALVLMARSSGTVLGQNEAREAIDEAVQDAVEAVEGNYAQFEDANQAPFAAARQALNALVGRLNGVNKFAEATQVQNALANLEKIVMQKAVPVIVGPKPKPQPVPLVKPEEKPPTKPLLERIAGKWTHPNSHLFYNIEANGSFREHLKTDSKINSEGTLVLLSPDRAEVKLTNNYRVEVRPADSDSLAILVWDSAGKPWGLGIVIQRIK